jgi:CDP-6-deoxy-D-xylo-4-hexulose-3-dehydrase
LGFSQLKKLPDFKMVRQENYNFLAKKMVALKDIFVPMEVLEESNPCWFGYPLIFKSDENNINSFISYLENDCKIGTRRLFAGNLLRHPAYIKLSKEAYKVKGVLNNTDRIMNNVIWVGVHPSLNEDCMNYIFESIYQFFTP